MIRHSKRLKGLMIVGYLFLYLPLILTVLFSFNTSRQMAHWSGFSLRWYKDLWNNHSLLKAALTSLEIATITATLAVIIGTIAAVVLTRRRRFAGRRLLGVLTSAPLVMPDVVTGLSLLLLFVTLEHWIGWPRHRGMMTIIIAHTTLAISYVTIVVSMRLRDFDHRLEEAAQDLGARPWTVFAQVTLPIVAPSLIASWLLSFAISLDDVVMASFLSGPGATTLPMIVFSSLRTDVTPELNALATIIIALVMVGIVAASILLQRRTYR